MQNDLATFWRRSERAHDLFYDLRDRSERGAYDEEYLARGRQPIYRMKRWLIQK